MCVCVCICVSKKKHRMAIIIRPKNLKFAQTNTKSILSISNGRNRISRPIGWNTGYFPLHSSGVNGVFSLSTVNNVEEKVDSHPLVFKDALDLMLRFACLVFQSIVNIIYETTRIIRQYIVIIAIPYILFMISIKSCGYMITLAAAVMIWHSIKVQKI